MRSSSTWMLLGAAAIVAVAACAAGENSGSEGAVDGTDPGVALPPGSSGGNPSVDSGTNGSDGSTSADGSATVDGSATTDGSTTDPFATTFCDGVLMSTATALSHFAPGATSALLGRYATVLRYRSCNATTGCTAWNIAPTTSPFLSNLVAAGTCGEGGAAYPNTGNAYLVVGSSPGSVDLRLISDPATVGCASVNFFQYYTPDIDGVNASTFDFGLSGIKILIPGAPAPIEMGEATSTSNLTDHCLRAVLPWTITTPAVWNDGEFVFYAAF